jgi:hypothetical protein
MNIILKKSTVIVSILLFLISAMSSAYSVSITKNEEISNDNLKNTMIIYRVAPDGSTTPIEINIEDDIDDISKYLDYKCYELFEEDIEMQSLIKNLQKKYSEDKNLPENLGLFRVHSKGRGLHIKTKLGLIFFSSRFMILRVILATFLISPKKGLVMGIYNNDETANTTIISANSSTTNLNGNHVIIAGGFFGYTTWTGRHSRLRGLSNSLLRLPRSFRGLCTLVFYTQL